MTTVRSPRPGVRFEVALARRPSALPRLDVAGFVGFAAAGPLDVPVPVEDVASFRDVFGPDVDLARDEGNEPVRSELGPAVEAFFANGGRRAWVVRVAARGPGGATRARWRVPGLYDVERRRWASVVARSEGTWAEPLGVGAREETLVLPAARDGYTLLATGELVELGDLVRARCAGGRFGWFEVTRIHGRAAELRDLDLWFETFVPGPGALGAVVVDGVPHTPVAWSIKADGGLVLTFDEEIPAGALLSLGTGRALATRAGLAPVGDRAAWSVETSALVRRIDGIAIDIAQPTAWERVRLTLEIEENGRIQSRLSGLGLSEAHARSFSKLPDDHALFAPLSQSWVPSPDDEWIRAVRSPRFPVAGGRRHPRVVPLGLAGIELDSTIARARVDERDRAVRDGVAHFERSLFLDPALERERVGSLRSLIEGRLYAAATPSAPLGLYALWPVAEVALVAVPDAAHRAWAVMPAEAPPSLTTPVLEAVSPTHLAWTESIVVGGAGTPTYRLEAADRPDGEARAQLARGEDRTFTIAEGEGCSGLRHYRVRAELGALHSAWSNEVALRPSSVDFDPCAEPTLHAPVLTVHEGSPPTADTAVEWVAEGDTTYRLELAGDAEMSAPRVVFEGPAPTPAWIDLPTGADRVEWVRIRAERERTIGPWSAAVAVGGTARATALVLEDRGRYGLGTPSTRDVLVAVQRALLRLSAARGDVVAVLSLPQHYREAETSEHLSILLGGASATQVPAPTEAEARALAPSGALYHPWLRVDAGPGHAPDGTIVGMIAARTIARGAWVAPANTALAEITGAQRIGDAFATEMLEQGVNLITQTPRGFLPRGARTLARGTELSELSVVRLGHLIRRLIERDGPRYAFEPNDLGLSRRIEDDLSELLGRLHQLGAFRGRSASDAFRVVADDRVNRVEDRERGRFVVELSYAPSMPLQFLTVRLVGSARGGLELVGVST